MLRTEQARKCADFWKPEMRDEKLRQHFAEIDMPEDMLRAIESGRVMRTMERKTRLLEIEQTL